MSGENGRVTTTRPANREELGVRLRGSTRLFGVLLVAAVLPLFLPLPWRLAGLAFALGTLVVGVRLLFVLAAFRREGGRGSGFLGVSVGLGLAAVLLVQLGLQAALYPIVKDEQDCLARAATLRAEELCRDETERRLDELVGPAGRSIGGAVG